MTNPRPPSVVFAGQGLDTDLISPGSHDEFEPFVIQLRWKFTKLPPLLPRMRLCAGMRHIPVMRRVRVRYGML